MKSERLQGLRVGLKSLLGGRCAYCGEVDFSKLEVDHPAGCTWVQRGLNTGQRWTRYVKEYQDGVPLRLLCRSCNAAENQWKHGGRCATRGCAARKRGWEPFCAAHSPIVTAEQWHGNT